MTAALVPHRHTLTLEQAAAAVALAGLKPTPRSPLSHLPPPAKPAKALAGTGAVDAQGRLAPETAAALALASDPHAVLQVVANRAGRPTWTRTHVLRGETIGPYVFLAETEGGLDLAYVPSSAQALVLLDAMLGLTTLPAPPAAGAAELGLAGYAALLAGADLVQANRLQARLDRRPRPLPAIEPAALEAVLRQGLAAGDTRWAVTASRFACPADLQSAQDRMGDGIAELAAAGLLDARRSFTPAGFETAAALGQLFDTGGLTFAGAAQGGTSLAHVTVFRTATSIRLASWTSLSSRDARVRVRAASATGALGAVRALLEAPADAAPARANACPACGHPAAAGARFCASCGRPLAP